MNDRKKPVAEFDVRFVVVCSQTDGDVGLRYFRSPQDAEGISIRLRPSEAKQLAVALQKQGVHAVLRDDSL